MNTDTTLALINPANALSTRTYKNSETRSYSGALKFIPFCKAEGLDDTNSTHADRVRKHSDHCNVINGKAQALIAGSGLVFDKVSVNTNNKDGIRRISMTYVQKVLPKEKVSKTVKLATRVSSASAEAQAKIDAILAEDEAKTITVS